MHFLFPFSHETNPCLYNKLKYGRVTKIIRYEEENQTIQAKGERRT